MLIQATHRVAGGRVEQALHAIELGANFEACGEALAGKSTRQGDVADAKRGIVGVLAEDKGSESVAKEIRPARAGHTRYREIARQAGRRWFFMRGHRAQAGMKADKGAAADGNSRRCTRHHIVVARPMIALI